MKGKLFIPMETVILDGVGTEKDRFNKIAGAEPVTLRKHSQPISTSITFLI
jgi:hypothetical protein